MQHFTIKNFFLLWIFLLGSVNSLIAQTPMPQVETLFQLTMSDGTEAQAVFLPTIEGRCYLVLSTETGKIGLWTMIPMKSPLPPEPQPPKPPIAQKLTIGIVEEPSTTTLDQKKVMVDKEWRELAIAKHNFLGLIPQNITEGGTDTPPAALVPFLDRAKGKPLPWIVLFNETGKLIWEGALPKTPSEMTAVIKKFGG